MTDVFISYSRKDKPFVQRLHQSLEAEGRDAWVDWEGIPLTADWWVEIQAGIEAADTFVFVISPDSAASQACIDEVEHAEMHNKRIVPIVYRDVSPKELPPILGKLNWVFSRESDDFDVAFHALTDTMDNDLNWVKAHTRLVQRAVEWDKHDRSDSFVLRGEDLAEAEQMQIQTGKEPKLTELQAQYILASRQSATRRQRITLAAVTFGFVVAIALGLVAFANEQRAITQSQIALAQSLALIAPELASDNLSENDELAILLAIEAVRQNPSEGRNIQSLLDHGLREVLGDKVSQVLPHDDRVYDVAISPDGKVLASASGETVYLWDLERRREIRRLEQHTGTVTAVAFSLDGKFLASASIDNTIILRDLTAPDGNPIIFTGFTGMVTSIAFNPEKPLFASASYDNSAMLWDLSNPGKEPKIFPHYDAVLAIAFNPDGTKLATVSLDGTVQVWDIETTEEILTLISGPRLSSAAYSFDGRRLATGDFDGNVLLWDAESGQVIGSFACHQESVTSVAFSPDGNSLAAASTDNTICIWDLTAPAVPPATFRGHTDWTNSIAFTPDATILASASNDDTVRLWIANLDSLVDMACQQVSRNMTLHEWNLYLPNNKYHQTCPDSLSLQVP